MGLIFASFRNMRPNRKAEDRSAKRTAAIPRLVRISRTGDRLVFYHTQSAQDDETYRGDTLISEVAPIHTHIVVRNANDRTLLRAMPKEVTPSRWMTGVSSSTRQGRSCRSFPRGPSLAPNRCSRRYGCAGTRRPRASRRNRCTDDPPPRPATRRERAPQPGPICKRTKSSPANPTLRTARSGYRRPAAPVSDWSERDTSRMVRSFGQKAATDFGMLAGVVQNAETAGGKP